MRTRQPQSPPNFGGVQIWLEWAWLALSLQWANLEPWVQTRPCKLHLQPNFSAQPLPWEEAPCTPRNAMRRDFRLGLGRCQLEPGCSRTWKMSWSWQPDFLTPQEVPALSSGSQVELVF